MGEQSVLTGIEEGWCVWHFHKVIVLYKQMSSYNRMDNNTYWIYICCISPYIMFVYNCVPCFILYRSFSGDLFLYIYVFYLDSFNYTPKVNVHYCTPSRVACQYSIVTLPSQHVSAHNSTAGRVACQCFIPTLHMSGPNKPLAEFPATGL